MPNSSHAARPVPAHIAELNCAIAMKTHAFQRRSINIIVMVWQRDVGKMECNWVLYYVQLDLGIDPIASITTPLFFIGYQAYDGRNQGVIGGVEVRGGPVSQIFIDYLKSPHVRPWQDSWWDAEQAEISPSHPQTATFQGNNGSFNAGEISGKDNLVQSTRAASTPVGCKITNERIQGIRIINCMRRHCQ